MIKVTFKELKIKRRFLSKYFTFDFSLRGEIDKFSLPLIVDTCINSLLPKEVFKNNQLINLKGREGGVLFSETSPREMPRRDELLYVGGKIIERRKNGEEFALRVTSDFHSFDGPHTIIHTPRIIREGMLPDFVPVTKIGRVFPVELTLFRMGLEYFESKFVTISLGYSPIVTETLLIEATQNEFRCKISADSLKSKDALPLMRDGLWGRLNQIIEPLAPLP